MRLQHLATRLTRLFIPALSTLLLGACITGGTQTRGKSDHPWVGVFVSEGYADRAQGAHWGAIIIDSNDYVQVRFRADLAPSPCNYDFYADIEPGNTTTIHNVGLLRGDTLEVTDMGILCDDSISSPKKFVRLTDPLDDSQLMPVLHSSIIKEESSGAFDLRQEGRRIIIEGRSGAADTILLAREYVQDHFADTLSGDTLPTLFIAINDFRLDEHLIHPRLIAYATSANGILERIEVEDYTKTPYTEGRGHIVWVTVEEGTLTLCFPLVSATGESTGYMRRITYRSETDATKGKRLVISGATKEIDENCYH